MATCPKGHQSATLDYCDVCGTPIGAPTAAPAASAAPMPAPQQPAPQQPAPQQPAPQQPAPQQPDSQASQASPTQVTSCPVCGAAQTGRFCEEDGYDFLLAPPVDPAHPAPPPAAETPPPAKVTSRRWAVEVHADPAYFQVVKSIGGQDTDTLTFPRFAPQRRFELTGEQMLIGRRSRSRGVSPDIDLVGPPEDPGVSHLHALLVAQPDGWAVVDLESANGTHLNDPSSNPIEPNVAVPIEDGDKVYLGAWTVLTFHAS